MKTFIPLYPSLFNECEKTILENSAFKVVAFAYPNGIAALKLVNKRGFVEVLPFMGQIIWDANFDGKSLRMTNMYQHPHPATTIVDTYGCFAFHSGLLAAGCPAPDDNHPLHGEFPCMPMDKARLELSADEVSIISSYEYAKGFGHHYLAEPKLTLQAEKPQFIITMSVKNLSKYQAMPLQYMCHMNYAFVTDGVMRSNLPEQAFQLRQTIPAHVTPTPEWTQLNKDILSGKFDANSLTGAEVFDPEIVYFADNLPQYGEQAHFELIAPDKTTYFVDFSTKEFPVATRWILHNADQKVAAFVLPGTSRPEGFNAAKAAGALMMLPAGEQKVFNVLTGILEK